MGKHVRHKITPSIGVNNRTAQAQQPKGRLPTEVQRTGPQGATPALPFTRTKAATATVKRRPS